MADHVTVQESRPAYAAALSGDDVSAIDKLRETYKRLRAELSASLDAPTPLPRAATAG